MTDLPIIYSAVMVQALLREAEAPGSGKTMTRRLAYTERRKRKPALGESDRCVVASPWQKAKAGDRLWVRESWKPHSIYAHLAPSQMPKANVFYMADGKYEPSNVAGIPSIHMPRWASRLTLIVTGTKTEPLQDISEADAIAEGLRPFGPHPGENGPVGGAADAFALLWRDLHGPGSWDANPLVVAISFRVIKANIDALEAQAA